MANAKFNDYVHLIRGFNMFTQLMRCDCINGYAVGRKYSNGKPLDQVSIIVYVNKKTSLRRLPISNRIPKRLSMPTEAGTLEFITDVQEARFSALSYTEKERPARSGISIGHKDISAGTLGGLVYDKVEGKTVILSNNHVIAASNDAVIGDEIIQPGSADGGTVSKDLIARLTRFVPIDFSRGAQNRVDGAIATPIDPDDVLWNTRNIGLEAPNCIKVLNEGDIGLRVQKTGRTTGHTWGQVDALYATTQIKYGIFRNANFVDQIVVTTNPGDPDFSNGGDSGSLVYDEESCCVGLLFGGSEGGPSTPGTTLINPIQYVFSQLNVGLLTPGSHPTTRLQV